MNKKIAFRVDGNEVIGFGHFSRCITIAKEFIKNDFDVMFIISCDSSESLLKENNLQFVRLNNTFYNKWNKSELCDYLLEKSFYLLFIDSYHIDLDYECLSSNGLKVFYLDDLYDLKYQFNAVFNYNIEATKEMYPMFKNHLFLGPHYFPLKNEFKKIKRKINDKVESVLITCGSTDNNKIIFNLLKVLCPNYQNITFNVLFGVFFTKEYKSELLNLLSEYKNIKIVNWGSDYLNALNIVDLIISPGSTTIYEALSIGIPCISFEFVDNHHLECIHLNKLGMVPYLGKYGSPYFIDNLLPIFDNELKYQVREKRRQLFIPIFDGCGSERIYERILEVAYENNN